jgi:hypothetical protein
MTAGHTSRSPCLLYEAPLNCIMPSWITTDPPPSDPYLLSTQFYTVFITWDFVSLLFILFCINVVYWYLRLCFGFAHTLLILIFPIFFISVLLSILSFTALNCFNYLQFFGTYTYRVIHKSLREF